MWLVWEEKLEKETTTLTMMKNQKTNTLSMCENNKTAGNIGQCTLIIVLQYYFGFNKAGC